MSYTKLSGHCEQFGCDFMQLGKDHILTVAISGISEEWYEVHTVILTYLHR